MWGDFFQIYQDKMWGGGAVRVSQLSTHPHNKKLFSVLAPNRIFRDFYNKNGISKVFFLQPKYSSSVFLRLISYLLRQTSH